MFASSATVHRPGPRSESPPSLRFDIVEYQKFRQCNIGVVKKQKSCHWAWKMKSISSTEKIWVYIKLITATLPRPNSTQSCKDNLKYLKPTLWCRYFIFWCPISSLKRGVDFCWVDWVSIFLLHDSKPSWFQSSSRIIRRRPFNMHFNYCGVVTQEMLTRINILFI